MEAHDRHAAAALAAWARGVVARADEAKDRALQTRCEKAPANSPVGVRGGWGFFKR